jgi:GT2 family glycosyltransferase
MVRCAVVILNWNGIEYLKKFLPGVLDHSSGDDINIYVADNGSNDGSAEYISEYFSSVNLIRLSKNNGFAGGYNLALEQIEALYYVLLNSDIEVTEGWLQPLISYMEKNSDVASCQPKILSFLHKDKFEYAGAAGGFIDKYGYPLCRGRIFDHTEKDEGQYNDLRNIFWSTGACMVVRAEAWKRCGGLDPDFFAHMEEIDLCWRFHKSGYHVAYIPQSVVYHVGGAALPYNSPLKTFLNFRNSLYMLYKNLPDKDLHSTLFKRKVLDGIAALFFLVKGEFKSCRAVWKANMEYYRNIEQLKEKRKKAGEAGKIDFTGLILNKSIVFEFYIKRHKTFLSLKTKS